MELNSNRIIHHVETFELDVHSCYEMWTTSSGLKTFFGYDNQFELKIGGPFEVFMYKKRAKGDQGSEGSRILSFVPDKMISISWVAPPKFKELRKLGAQTWITVFFESVDKGTSISIYHQGWPDDEKWNKLYEYYSHVWGFVLNSFGKAVLTRSEN